MWYVAGTVQEYKNSLGFVWFFWEWLAFCKVWISWWVQHFVSLPPHHCSCMSAVRVRVGGVRKSWLFCFVLFFWGGLFWLSLPIRCKFPGTQFILGLLQFVFSLFQFSLHFEEKQVDGRVHHGRPQLGHARLLDLLEVLDLRLQDTTNTCQWQEQINKCFIMVQENILEFGSDLQ